MALIACPECNAQVSNQAIACPSCGARPPKPKKSSGLSWALLAILLVILVWASMGSSDPIAREKADARATISTCWDDQKAKSHAPGTARFVAGVCEKLERDFTAKYGHTP